MYYAEFGVTLNNMNFTVWHETMSHSLRYSRFICWTKRSYAWLSTLRDIEPKGVPHHNSGVTALLSFIRVFATCDPLTIEHFLMEFVSTYCLELHVNWSTTKTVIAMVVTWDIRLRTCWTQRWKSGRVLQVQAQCSQNVWARIGPHVLPSLDRTSRQIPSCILPCSRWSFTLQS